MSTLLASAAVATAMLSHCSWNQPGRNPYRGSVTEAVSRYVDIPAPVRARLIARIESGRADDTVAIMRDSIAGKYDYSPRITGMHFGQRTLCETVTRDGWSATAREPAAVYCVGEQCLIVPKICGNISRVQRVAGDGSPGGAPRTGAAAPAQVDIVRAAEPAFARVASPDDVAAADAMAHAPSRRPLRYPLQARRLIPGSPPGGAGKRATRCRVRARTRPFRRHCRRPTCRRRPSGSG